MQNPGNFAIILVNYKFPRLVQPGAGNTQKRSEFLWHLKVPSRQDTESSCIFRDLAIFMDFRGNCVSGGEYAEFTEMSGFK